MAMDSTEFAKLTKKSVGESSEESAAKPPATKDPVSEGTTQSESESSNPRRRKGRTPVKNLPPVTKRLSTSAETPAADAVGPEAVKKKRGRPRKNHSKVNSDEVMSQDEGGAQDEGGSETIGDVSEPLVKRRAVGRPRRGTSNDADSRDQEQVMLHSGLVWVLLKV